ncbi:MAG: phytanoyl-CoA dioxygenase family protein [bacterium]|nr:phytanoyl-CoA dioxygenase family protein [bacterium]
MEPACLAHCLTEEERTAFEQDGFFVVEDVLTPQMIEDLTQAVERADGTYRQRIAEDRDLQDLIVRPGRMAPHDRLELVNILQQDPVFLDLVDLPQILPKVWGILGWNIKLYVTQLVMTPPVPAEDQRKTIDGWHRDSGRLNIELETVPKPRVSLKVGFFLTDTTTEEVGNFYVIRGSQLQNEVVIPEDGGTLPEGAQAVRVNAGSAVIFDRRIWHSSSRNFSDITRKVLFYGYSYRWLQPRDDMTVAHLMEGSDPIRRQLLGASPNGGFGFTSPKDEDVPLKVWLQEHLGEAAVMS